MKSLSLLLISILVLSSCSETTNPDDLTAQKVEDIKFYTYDGKRLSKEDLASSWNEMINQSTTPNLYKAGTFEIKKIKISDSDEFEYALVATNTADRIQTAAKIVAFEDGYKISNRSVSCKNCEVNMELPSSDGYWYCSGNNDSGDCTKTSRLYMDDTVVSNPDAKIVFSVQFTDAPQEGIKTLERKIYSVYTNTTNKKELCGTKSLLSDVAYEETWVIEDKNDPKQNRMRTKIKEIEAQQVLEIMCNAGDDAVFFSGDMEKIGVAYKDYTAFTK